jgi:predicted esterase
VADSRRAPVIGGVQGMGHPKLPVDTEARPARFDGMNAVINCVSRLVVGLAAGLLLLAARGDDTFAVYAGSATSRVLSSESSSKAVRTGRYMLVSLDGQQLVDFELFKDAGQKQYRTGESVNVTIGTVAQPVPSAVEFTTIGRGETIANAIGTDGTLVESTARTGRNYPVSVRSGESANLPRVITGTEDSLFTGGTDVGAPFLPHSARSQHGTFALKLQSDLSRQINDVPGQTWDGAVETVKQALLDKGYNLAGAKVTYNATAMSLMSGGATRTYLLARPSNQNASLPLIIALHGDGGTGASFRTQLKLENQLRGSAVVAYLDAASDNTFEYYTVDGRDREAAVITKLISDLKIAGVAREDRVFLTGFSGGATMVNCVAARLGRPAIRAVGIMSGSIYAIDDDITFNNAGGIDNLPPAIIIWGKSDTGSGTQYASAGLFTRDVYLASFHCSSNTVPVAPSPSVSYPGDPSNITWSAIPNMGHAIWSRATEALWLYFASQM